MTYQPKTTAEQREDFAKFPGRIGQHLLADLAACEAALAEEQRRSQWRDIETAPKDGTLLLGWWAEGMQGKGLPFILTWAKWLDGSKDGVMCWMDFERAWPRQPMFWQPLPQPPERSV